MAGSEKDGGWIQELEVHPDLRESSQAYDGLSQGNMGKEGIKDEPQVSSFD